ncbi:protein aurora borealis [Anopheles nili]|uniref:protein aurora borealis n=1 Tax=Anopheles nili TaxID=185578 RepID=UPI00237A142A|nr:protein aurora borealis [Anopheles nili]
MESESFLTPRKLIVSALARTSSRSSMASSPSLMAVQTPTSLSRNSTSCSNTNGSRFNLLPVLHTPPSRMFKGRIVNPFESHLADRLHLPMIGSPSLFQRPSTPLNSSMSQFEWNIDDVSSLGPANVEPHETQFLETPDPVKEARAQAAISTYFKEHSIVPSPIECHLRNQKIVLAKENLHTSTSGSVTGSTKRKFRDGTCQTVLTFPPNLPKVIEDVLQKYLIFNEDQQQKHELPLDVSSSSSIDHDARDASLRRKLFNTSAINEDTDSDAGSANRFQNSIEDLDLRALSPPPISPEVMVIPELANVQDLKRIRYYGSQDILNHVIESDGDSSFGALSPISKSSLSPSPNEAYEQHHSDVDAIYRSTPEPSTTYYSDNQSPGLSSSQLITGGSIKHTELTAELAETNLSNDGERSLTLSSQSSSSDLSQRVQHSITPLRGHRRKDQRKNNRKNLSQSFLQLTDNNVENVAHRHIPCDMSASQHISLKELSPIKEIVGLSETEQHIVNFYRTDSGFNEENQSNDFVNELSDVSMLSGEFVITPGKKIVDTIDGYGTDNYKV